MNKLSKDLKYLISLLIIVFAAVIATFAHHGHLLIDCGREAYYPTQILLGKVLYKDIFNIYGPFSYLFNAILFKIFGINLNVLYMSGTVCTALITGLIYCISKRFLPPFVSFSIAIFTVFTGVLTHYLSNFIFPYSYAMLYGLVSFLFSVLFLLKYEEDKNNKYLYISSLFAGLSIACKYEFLPYFAVIIFSMIRVKPLKFKQIALTISFLLLMPLSCFAILFMQGLNLNDISTTLHIYNKMAHSNTLKYFYHLQGIYFNVNILKAESIAMAETLLALAGFWAAYNIRNVFFSICLVFISSLLTISLTTPISFGLVPILIVALAIFDIKSLKNNTLLQFLVTSSICFSFKEFWGLIIPNYGVYFIGFLLIALTALISDLLKDKNVNFKGIGMYFILSATILSYNNLHGSVRIPLVTQSGKIFSSPPLVNSSLELIDYINKNTKKTDTIVILPEGAMINFITKRPSDNYYTSLIPLYVEVFGESEIINHFKNTKPEYVIFNNWDTSEYYFRYICQDYAVSFCNYIASNYKEEKVLGKDFRYLIFKRK